MTVPHNSKKDMQPTTLDTPVKTPQNEPQALMLDVEFYQSFLDDTDIPEDKKREFIEALWLVLVSIIDIGFEVKPMHLDKRDEQTAKALSTYLVGAKDFATQQLNQEKRISDPESATYE